MGRFPKPCAKCGILSIDNLCPQHLAEATQQHNLRRDQVKRATRQYSGDYKRRAKTVRDNATTCHLCGQGTKPGDPFEADHINAGQADSILLPAHRSCNQARGNKPLN